MVPIRKTLIQIETIHEAEGRILDAPITRAAGIAVIANPFAGKGYVEDLTPLFTAGRDCGTHLTERLVAALPRPAVNYGKAAVVGLAGAMEHGGACIHPRLGAAMRGPIGGGKALIPSNCKVAAPGSAIDVPLGHKDEAWSFAHFDTMTVSLAEAPLPDEIAVIVALADGARPVPRVGTGPLTD